MQLRRLLGRLDAWPNPTIEVWVGCIILVLSSGFWTSAGADANRWPTVIGAILGPLLVYRAWKRKPSTVRCDICGERAPVFDDDLGRFEAIDCPRCGPHVPGEALAR